MPKTFRPRPTATYVSSPCVRDSARIPASFRPPTYTSLGHLSDASSPVRAASVSRTHRATAIGTSESGSPSGARREKGQVDAHPRGRHPEALAAASARSAPAETSTEERQRLLLGEVELDHLPRQIVRRARLLERHEVLERPPRPRIELSAREIGIIDRLDERAARRFSSSTSFRRVFSTTSAGALSR